MGFRDFFSGRAVDKRGAGAPRARKKRLVVFLLAVFGVAAHAWGTMKPLPAPAHSYRLTLARALMFSRADLIKENDITAVTVKLNPRNSRGGLTHGGQRRAVEGLHARGSRRVVPKRVDVLERRKVEEPKTIY